MRQTIYEETQELLMGGKASWEKMRQLVRDRAAELREKDPSLRRYSHSGMDEAEAMAITEQEHAHMDWYYENFNSI